MGVCYSCCCGCFGVKPNKSSTNKRKFKELSPLKRVKYMKKTMNGKDINLQINRRIITKEQQNQLKTESYELEVLLSEPYNRFSQITSNLFLTGIGGINEENIRQNDIKHIVNVTYELPVYEVSGIDSIKIPVDDDSDEDLSIYFPEMIEKMQKWTQNNENTVVHCLCGVSRSVTIVLAFLMKDQRLELRDAFRLVQQKRDFVRPNNSFFRQLIDFEKILFKRNTTKLVEKETETNEKVIIPDFGPQYPELSIVEDNTRSLDSKYSSSKSIITLFVKTPESVE